MNVFCKKVHAISKLYYSITSRCITFIMTKWRNIQLVYWQIPIKNCDCYECLNIEDFIFYFIFIFYYSKLNATVIWIPTLIRVWELCNASLLHVYNFTYTSHREKYMGFGVKFMSPSLFINFTFVINELFGKI